MEMVASDFGLAPPVFWRFASVAVLISGAMNHYVAVRRRLDGPGDQLLRGRSDNRSLGLLRNQRRREDGQKAAGEIADVVVVYGEAATSGAGGGDGVGTSGDAGYGRRSCAGLGDGSDSLAVLKAH